MASLKSCVIGLAVIIGIALQPFRAMAADENQIADGMKVSVEYTISLADDTRIVTHVGEYVHGERQIVLGLEKALTGMKPGESKRVPLTPDQAFGSYDDKKKRTVDRVDLPHNAEAGSILETEYGQLVTVLQLSESSAVLDYNHPLAGKNLIFDVKILKVEGNRGSML